MRKVGMAGIAILLLSIIISGANYLSTRGFEWNPGDLGFIYSSLLTVGFIASIGAGMIGAIRESEEFLIAGGAACIALALLNRLFANVLYSLSYMEVILLLAGVLMIADRFHVKRVKEARRLEEAAPERLLEELDRLEAEARPDTAIEVEKELSDLERRLQLEAEKRPELAKPLRIRMYRKPIVQEIVNRYIGSGLKAIEPTIETSRMPIYPELSSLEGYPQEKLQSTLDRLADSGILLKDLYEKLVSCPHCHQPSKVFLRNKCPKCGSHKTHLNRLMEHLKCGAIFEYEKFRRTDGSLSSCPKCKRTVKEEVELKPVGIAFECDSCKNAFSDPIRAFYCRSCAAEFKLESGELLDTYSYFLNDRLRSEAMENLTVLAIEDMIKKLGFKTKMPGVLKGKSGVSHEVTLLCSKGDQQIAIDLSISERIVDMETALSSYAKFLDIQVAKPLLIAIPRLERKAKGFLESNEIAYVEGRDVSEIKDKVKQHLE